MINDFRQKTLEQFLQIGEILSCNPFGDGHINDTYLLESTSNKFILQRVNKNVFRTGELVENYEVLVDLVTKYEEKSGRKITPEIFKTKAGKYHFVDTENYAWRLVEFIPDAASYNICPNPEVARKAAKAIGEYQLFLNTIDPALLQETIVGFHNLPKRFETFKDSLKNVEKHLFDTSEEEIKEALSLAFLVDETSEVLDCLPERVNHNDTKLNNVLFKDDEVLVIDLDTVMPGNLMFDFGDMVRTFTSPAFEDEKDISKTEFRIEFFKALTDGYLKPLRETLSENERKSLLSGAFYIIYEQALRFLTDYLEGNVYYKVACPEHNLLRARTQLKLLQLILKNQDELNRLLTLYS